MQEKIRTNPKRIIRKLTSEDNVSYGLMQTILKIDLNLSPFIRSKAHVLSLTVRARRLNRARLVVEGLEDGSPPPMLWTDKKLFTVQVIKMIGFMQ